ncbi:hypothetical protein L7F22_051601 [Adiantum nelumboides]|nr:hypothetical protein [Adiantum nelumboides]
MQKKQHWSFLSFCCPMLIIEVVESTLRVGGAAFLDKPCHQPFTLYLHILRFQQDQDHWETVSRALGSIRVAIASLVEFYLNLQRWRVGERYYRQSGSSLYFICITLDGKQRIIKICQRYGDKVHAQWAEKGYALAFHHAVLQGGWLVINMKYYVEEDGWRPLIALDPRLLAIGDTEANKYRLTSSEWEKCKFDVRKTYERYMLLTRGYAQTEHSLQCHELQSGLY